QLTRARHHPTHARGIVRSILPPASRSKGLDAGIPSAARPGYGMVPLRGIAGGRSAQHLGNDQQQHRIHATQQTMNMHPPKDPAEVLELAKAWGRCYNLLREKKNGLGIIAMAKAADRIKEHIKSTGAAN